MGINWLTVGEEQKIMQCGANYGIPRSVTMVACDAYTSGNYQEFYDLLSEWADDEAISAVERKIKEYTEGD